MYHIVSIDQVTKYMFEGSEVFQCMLSSSITPTLLFWPLLGTRLLNFDLEQAIGARETLHKKILFSDSEETNMI